MLGIRVAFQFPVAAITTKFTSFQIPFVVVLHWLVKDAELEMPSLPSSQMEGRRKKTSFNPCQEEGIQTNLLSLEYMLSTLIARWGASMTSTQDSEL